MRDIMACVSSDDLSELLSSVFDAAYTYKNLPALQVLLDTAKQNNLLSSIITDYRSIWIGGSEEMLNMIFDVVQEKDLLIDWLLLRSEPYTNRTLFMIMTKYAAEHPVLFSRILDAMPDSYAFLGFIQDKDKFGRNVFSAAYASPLALEMLLETAERLGCKAEMVEIANDTSHIVDNKYQQYPEPLIAAYTRKPVVPKEEPQEPTPDNSPKKDI
jgi:hypothetical protein